ncbi:MAG: hypothetical protein IJ065_13155 [Eubacterium sp.]|nr:hypothetical protein [Eubacterium sp.]
MADEKNINDSFDVIPDEKPEAESISMDDVMKSAIEDAAAAAAGENGTPDDLGESATTVLTADMIGQPEEMATTVLTTDMLTQQNVQDEPATTILTTDMLTQQQNQQMPGSGPMMPGSGPMMPGSGPMMPGSGPMGQSGPMMNNIPNGGFNGNPQAAQMMPGSGPMMPGSGPMMPGSGPMMPGSGPMMPGSGPMMPGSGPMQQMRVPQPPETAKKSSGGLKAVGLVSMIIAILGLAAVIVIYILFGMPKTDYGSSAQDKLKAPVVTEASASDQSPETDNVTEENTEAEQDEE